MKKLIAALLVLTTTVGYAQDTTSTLPSSPEELDTLLSAPPVDEAPVVNTDTPAEVTPEIVQDVPQVEDKTPEVAVEPEAELKTTPAITSTLQADDDEAPFNLRTGHWVGTFGFENSKYELPLQFNGYRKDFGKTDRELWGGRLGIGREAYLGGGFLLQGRLEGYYMGTLFEGRQTADPEFTTSVANTKNTGQLFGADAVAHLGWMFDFQAKNIFLGDISYMALELFVEAGVGKGKSYQRQEYLFDASQVDVYDFIMEDEFTTQTLSTGLNLLSATSGFFMYMRATQSNINLDSRKIRTKILEGGAAGSQSSRVSDKYDDNNANIDPIFVYAIGGGYKF